MNYRNTDYALDSLDHLSLGKTVEYGHSHDAQLLQAVSRQMNREKLNLTHTLPFHGHDVWTAYEVSWLNLKGKPQVAIATFYFPHDSTALVESKSFKLYLNSLNQSKFGHLSDVQQLMIQDLSALVKAPVRVSLLTPYDFSQQKIMEFEGTLLDDLDIEIKDYDLTPELLKDSIEPKTHVSEVLVSHLLKSNCLITSQPDWASIQIKYQGPAIRHEALLRYLISFREHHEFHEQCVERIFVDLSRFCQCEQLTVYARYTRRGGLDINPFRSNFESLPEQHRQARQ
jgi:7-cyano-7-deazaguanine reductase